jgi:hypothetical protein
MAFSGNSMLVQGFSVVLTFVINPRYYEVIFLQDLEK